MILTIRRPYALNELGNRENNEDSVFPPVGTATESDRLFMVCDGVGGEARGEVASKIVCESIAEWFRDKQTDSVSDASINIAVSYTQKRIDEYLEQNPASRGMGSTLTMLYLNTDGATVSWCGDSRVYHIRDQEIRFVTTDHSLVNELIKGGLITPEEAKNHPQRNVITRAIQGNPAKKVKAETLLLSDIHPNDYFFLCSDGILEQVTPEILVSILSGPGTDEEKMGRIKETCEGNTRDNFSAYLVAIENVTSSESNDQGNDVQKKSKGEIEKAKQPLLKKNPIPEKESSPGNKTRDYLNFPSRPKKKINKYKIFTFIFALAFLVTLGILFYTIFVNHALEEKDIELTPTLKDPVLSPGYDKKGDTSKQGIKEKEKGSNRLFQNKPNSAKQEKVVYFSIQYKCILK